MKRLAKQIGVLLVTATLTLLASETANAIIITATVTVPPATSDVGHPLVGKPVVGYVYFSQASPVNKTWHHPAIDKVYAYSDSLSITHIPRNTSGFAGFNPAYPYRVSWIIRPTTETNRHTRETGAGGGDYCRRWVLPVSWIAQKQFAAGTTSAVQQGAMPVSVYEGYWCRLTVPKPRHHLWTRDPDSLLLVA